MNLQGELPEELRFYLRVLYGHMRKVANDASVLAEAFSRTDADLDQEVSELVKLSDQLEAAERELEAHRKAAEKLRGA